MRTLFFGTPAIAARALEALHATTDVVGVVCQPDRPAGRGLELKPPETKVYALEHGIPVHQPKKVRTTAFADWVREQKADYGVVIAYGRILPKAVLDGPAGGCLNLHASILPKYRGAAPINWAIVHGETETGFSLMQMDEGMDTGPVFSIRRIPIGPDETAGELYVRLGDLSQEVIREALPRVASLTAAPQDHDAATMAPMLKREDGFVDWSQSATRVHDHVRGMTPWPGAHTTLDGKRLKVLRTGRYEGEVEGPPGTVRALGRKRLLVACADGGVELHEAQLAGRKALPAPQLLGGRVLSDGLRLGR